MGLARIPSSKDLWNRHEKLVLTVFLIALDQLRSEEILPEAENRINEKLLIHTKRAWKKLPAEKRPLWALSLESQNQPQSDEDVGTGWLIKKPDFQWQYVDHTDNTENGFKSYTIECKRLGHPLSKSRILNHEYVKNGIQRFVATEHSYGKGSWSGAMIGYVQNMDLTAIVEQLNTHILDHFSHKIPALKFSEVDFDERGIIKSSQKLTRKNVPPSSFDLRHLWVDLRR